MPWWMLPPLWGLDAPLVAAAWGVAFPGFYGVNSASSDPLILLVAVVWALNLLHRVITAALNRTVWYAPYYRSHAFPMLLLVAALLFASVWMALYVVGAACLVYGLVPLCLLALSMIPMPGAVRNGLRAWALAVACQAPACYFSFGIEPGDATVQPAALGLGALFFLFLTERFSLRYNGRFLQGGAAFACTLSSALLLCCYWRAAFSAPDHHWPDLTPVFQTLILGLACLHLYRTRGPRLPLYLSFSLGWPAMAVPALLALCFQSNPHFFF